MSTNRIPMTAAGKEQLHEELQKLKYVERPRVINAIAEARAHGDLKENAEYHSAREQQSFIEGRILEIETKLAAAHVIDVTQMENDGRVIFGSTITLKNVDTGNDMHYQIVGEDEANIVQNKISITSPVARALIGKYEGDIANVSTPQGATAYEITKVEYK